MNLSRALSSTLLAVLIGTAAASSARAGDATADATAPAPAPWWSRFYVRAGVIHVATLESSSEAELSAVDGPASLAVSSGPIRGSGSRVDDATIPGLTIGWVTPWLDGHLSIETLLGPPFEIAFHATGTLATTSLAPEALGLSTGVPPLGTEIGKARAAPPTLTAVYRFGRPDRWLRPYLGTGISVLLTYDRQVTNPILTEHGAPDFDIPPAPGLVLQGGLDVHLWRWLWATADVKFVAAMQARAKLSHVVVSTPELPLYEQAEVGAAEMHVWVNPLIVQLGVGANF